VIVLACERCLIRPATCHDSYADLVGCRTCYPAEPPSAYDCEFVLDCIPDDLSPCFPPRPTIEVTAP
jgi:hypothetical protein